MPRVVKKPFERKAEIVEAAKELFQEKEYEKVTMQDVMQKVGIAKGTIYHYFKSKEELLEVVVKEIVDTHVEKMKKLIKKSKGNALHRIKKLFVEGKKVSADGVLDALHKKGNEALHTRLLVEALMKQAPLYETLIKQGCKEGLFSTKSPLECSEFILSGIQFLTDVGIHPWNEKDLKRRVKAFPELIEQILKAPKGSFDFMK